MTGFDAIIVGAGIAGASLAAELAGRMRVLIVEREDAPGYHTTGRSNAFWHPTYGGPQIAPLTLASRKALESGGFLVRRSALTLVEEGAEAGLDAMVQSYAGTGIGFETLDRAGLEAILPALRPGWSGGVLEAEAFDIDVAGYHAACLARAKAGSAVLLCRAGVEAALYAAGQWSVETNAGSFSAPLLINAAGGWADELAKLAGACPLGIQPYRRTMVQLGLAKPVPADLPFVIDLGERFYFRPDGPERIWLSPHDETPTPPCDAAAEEIDIAIAIDWFEKVVDWPIRRVEHSWAGLRSFAPDRLPVLGIDPHQPGLFWCAGQGGFGIQTADAVARFCASLIFGDDLPSDLVQLKASDYAPARFI